jgi:hypothetical protein
MNARSDGGPIGASRWATCSPPSSRKGLGAGVLGSDPQQAGGQRVLFVSGDDADAKSEVSGLIRVP